MKRSIFLLMLIVSVIFSSKAQEKLKVGEFKNGKLLITEMVTFKGFLMNSLENSGTLAKEFQVSVSPEIDRVFVYYPVNGNAKNISSIGIMLVIIGHEAFIVENPPRTPATGPGGGGSLEIQCIGVDCNSCVPDIKWVNGNWMPIVYCRCQQPGGGQCNMITKVIFHIEVV